MDWYPHQEVHAGERDVLADFGVRQDAFNIALGNVMNEDNLPPRRQYGNISGTIY
jgi:hypothetical protein